MQVQAQEMIPSARELKVGGEATVSIRLRECDYRTGHKFCIRGPTPIMIYIPNWDA